MVPMEEAHSYVPTNDDASVNQSVMETALRTASMIKEQRPAVRQHVLSFFKPSSSRVSGLYSHEHTTFQQYGRKEKLSPGFICDRCF